MEKMFYSGLNCGIQVDLKILNSSGKKIPNQVEF